MKQSLLRFTSIQIQLVTFMFLAICLRLHAQQLPAIDRNQTQKFIHQQSGRNQSGKPAPQAARTFKKGDVIRLNQGPRDQNLPSLKNCGHVAHMEWMRKNHPEVHSDAHFEAWIGKEIVKLRKELANKRTENVIRIPVVVHIVHNGEAVGQGANISAQQVQSQIDVLNEDYRRKPGTPGFNNNPVGADTEIEFCLATVNPQGATMAEAGIDRVRGTRATYPRSVIETQLKPQTIWDPNKYLNMWTVTFGGDEVQLLGYAQFPNASGLEGMPAGQGVANTDGVTMRYSSFGRVGNVEPPFDGGRTTTHEVGHWLGLRHIWGDEQPNCGNDFCDDTPTSNGPNYGCNRNANNCSNRNMVENYMDYSDDPCMNIFTQNQKERMLAVLNNSPRRASLKTSNVCGATQPPTGCQAATQNPPLIEGFTRSGFPYADWFLINPDNDVTFELSNQFGGYGRSNNSIVIDNYNVDFSGKIDAFILPAVNLTNATNGRLEFDVAYKPYSLVNSDTLALAVSTDCGGTFITVWEEGGTTLASEPGFETFEFRPSGTQWKRVSLPISQLGGIQGKNNVRFAFINVSGYGNKMYIDNIRVLGSPGAFAPIPSFSSNNRGGCAGLSVQFTDKSVDNPSSWQWTFPGGTPASSTNRNPTVVYNTPGFYNVTLNVSNAQGNNSLTIEQYVFVGNGPSTSIPNSQGFENASFPPQNWSTVNVNNDNPQWLRTTEAGANSNASTFIDNYSNNNARGRVDFLYTPTYNLTGVANPSLEFDVAYALYNQTLRDTLIIYYSTNCGADFIPMYFKEGSSLATTSEFVEELFVPFPNEWRKERISLAGLNASSILFVFTNISGNGQDIYLDNIAVVNNTNCPGFPLASAANTNVCGGGTISLRATNIPNATYFWSGPNGFTSAQQNPSINNANVNQSGIYSVSAVRSGCFSLPSEVDVSVLAPQPVQPGNNGPVCAGSNLDLTAPTVGGVSYFWQGPAGFTADVQNPVIFNAGAANGGQYTVRTVLRGCSSATRNTSATISPTPLPPTLSINPGLTVITASGSVQGLGWLKDGSPINNSGTTLNVTGDGLYCAFTQQGNCRSRNVCVAVGEVAVKPQLGSSSWKFYPNPIDNQLIIENTDNLFGKARIQCLTLDGKLLLEKELNSGEPLQLNLQHLPTGAFLVKILTDKEVVVQKLLKK